MASADYVCCEVCGGKIVYSPEHQPEAVCGKCYSIAKAKADLFDEMVRSCRRHFAGGGKIVPLMAIIDTFVIKAGELK